ncbi:ychF [Symbiodinium microadriaticum]|nr:ychF [Symbiodinium microadriaticum]
MVCQIFDQICEANFSPDVYTYNAAIGACTRSGEWQLALHFFARSTDLNSDSMNAVLAAGERDGMRRLEKHQIYPRLLAKAVDILDLHDCNSEAATLAVRWWLSQVVLPILLKYGDRKFILVTGWGKSKPARKGTGSDVQEAVLSLLLSCGLPAKVQDHNKGRLEVFLRRGDAPTLRALFPDTKLPLRLCT